MYDCIIVGAGPGGLTAAIYLLRSNMRVAIVEESMPGGQIANTAVVENYPGFDTIDGVDLATRMYMQAANLGVEYISEHVIKVDATDNGFQVIFADYAIQGKSVIIATGMKRRMLHVPGETEFIGKGVSWCAICDGTLYRDKVVAVVGGGNSALEESLYLANLAKKVYLIHRRDEFRGDALVAKHVRNTPNIELLLSDEVEEMKGKKVLESLVLKRHGEIAVDAVFEYVGFLPASDIVADFHLTDADGFIEVNENCETRFPKLYAVGDITNKPIKQIATAVGDGATAAIHVARCCRS